MLERAWELVKRHSVWINLAISLALIAPYAINKLSIHFGKRPASAEQTRRAAAPAKPITDAPEGLPGEDDAEAAAVYQARILVPAEADPSTEGAQEQLSREAQNELSALAFNKSFKAPEIAGSGSVGAAPPAQAAAAGRASEETATWENAIQMKAPAKEASADAGAGKQKIAAGIQGLRGGNGMAGGIAKPFNQKKFSADNQKPGIGDAYSAKR
ncbi:MAG: hypothetical protein HY078_04980 [Elusimicrobia bacterium]|nr:hypothetical protein [Elusimicrobiota bacterium]